MKILSLLSLLLLSTPAFAQTLNCSYLNHDNSTGNVKLEIDVTTSSVKLIFDSLTVDSGTCTLKVEAQEITAECDEDGNSVGILLELIDGKFEGVLISEKAEVFGQANC